MREIMLTQGKVALVDDADFERVSAHNWFYAVRGYAVANTPRSQGRKSISMHRFIMGFPPGMQIDHIDGNRLNNQKSNLRICTQAQNRRNNLNCRQNKTSSFKGVHWHSKCGKWAAQIRANGQHHYLGLFEIEEDAARAYDDAATHRFGEFARLNFPKAKRTA